MKKFCGYSATHASEQMIAQARRITRPRVCVPPDALTGIIPASISCSFRVIFSRLEAESGQANGVMNSESSPYKHARSCHDSSQCEILPASVVHPLS